MEMLLWERSPVFSSLAAGNNKFFLLSIFGLVVSIGLNPPRGEPSVGVTFPLPHTFSPHQQAPTDNSGFQLKELQDQTLSETQG